MNLLTPKEAATRAKVSKSLIYSWCDERRLAHVRVGKQGKRGRILIKETDLEALMQEFLIERHPFLNASA